MFDAESNRRQKIIDDYAKLLENDAPGLDFVDESSLPYSKSEILDAIQLEIVRESDSNSVDIYVRAAECLVQYQPGIGNNSLRGLSSFLPEIQAAVQGSREEKMNVLRKVATGAGLEKYQHYEEMAQAELMDIRLKLVIAMKIREGAIAKKLI